MIRGVTVTPDAQIMVASREGAFRSTDSGTTWQRMLNGLPDRDISSISYDESGKSLLATSMAISTVFQSSDGGQTWQSRPGLRLSPSADQRGAWAFRSRDAV